MIATLVLSTAMVGFHLPLQTQEIQTGQLCRLVGTIADESTGAPLPNTVVTIPDLRLRRVTDSAGVFVIDSIPLGTYHVSIRRVGYEAVDGTLTVERSDSFEVNLRQQLPDFLSRGRIVGTVIDRSTRQPVAGAVVSVLEADRQVLTDEQGRFAIQELPAGVLSLSVEMLSYATRTEPINLRAGYTTSVEFALAVEPIELEPLVVEVRSRYLERAGFYRRAEDDLMGRRWTAEEIDHWAAFYLSDVLRHAPGVRVQRGFAGVRVTGRQGCRMTIYLDGFRVGRDFDLDMIPASTVGGLEVYQGTEVPIEYGHLSACGVVLVWTRL